MSTQESFRILFREQWVEPSGDSHGGGSVVRFDPSLMHGVMDLVVDGRPLFEHSGDDAIFFLMRDLLAAAERLMSGESIARVSFYETPFELVFQRNGEKVYLTFFKGGYSPEVIVKDRLLPVRSFLSGIADSAETLVRQTFEMDRTVGDDPLIRWMQDAVERVKKYARRRSFKDDAPAVESTVVESSRWSAPRTADGFSFGFRLRATATDLLSPGRLSGNDLHALLFRGQFVVHARERRRVMGEGYLFLQAEKMLVSLRKLLTAWEEGRPMSVRLLAEGISIALKLSGDDSLQVTLASHTDEESIIVLNDLSPWRYADAVLGVCREIRRAIISRSPTQRRNMRVETFARDVRQLSAMVRELRRGALINENPERYRDELSLSTRRESAMEIARSRALAFKERWHLEAEGLELRGTMLCGSVAVVSAHGYMLGVEVDSGAVIWRRDTDRGDARLQVAGRDGFVRVAQSGAVDMMDLQTGVLRWRTTLAPRSGGAPVVLVVDQGPLPAMVIAVEEDRNLVALDLRTGEIKWRYTVMRGGRFSLRKHGRLLYVASGDTQLSAIDLEDGSPVWRYPSRTRFYHPPAVENHRLFQVGGRIGRTDGRLFGIDAYTGVSLWSVELKGQALAGPIVAADTVLVPVQRRNSSDLRAFDATTGQELWKMPCDGWAQSCSLLPLDRQFIVNLAGGTVQSIHAKTGEVEWRTVLGPVCSDDIPLSLSVCLRGGALFVPADTVYVLNPENGQIIHCLGGDPPVPDLMNVHPDCSVFVAEESGHIGLYSVARSFTLVHGGK